MSISMKDDERPGENGFSGKETKETEAGALDAARNDTPVCETEGEAEKTVSAYDGAAAGDPSSPSAATPGMSAIIRWVDDEKWEYGGYYECVDLDTRETVVKSRTFRRAVIRLRKRGYVDLYKQISGPIRNIGTKDLAAILESGKRRYTNNPYAEEFCFRMGKEYATMRHKFAQKATELALLEYRDRELIV